MQRKTAMEKCERLRKLNGVELRRKCTRFVMDHAEEIAKAQPEVAEHIGHDGAAGLRGGQWRMKANGGAKIFNRDLVASLNGHTDRPWMVLRRGKEVTERWLSQQLSPYGIRP